MAKVPWLGKPDHLALASRHYASLFAVDKPEATPLPGARQRLAGGGIISDAFFATLTVGQGTAQVVASLGEVGPDFQGPPVMGHRLVTLARSRQGEPQAVVDLREVGPNGQRLPILCDCLVELATD